MTSARQGSPARYEALMANTGNKMQRIRAMVGREEYLRLVYKEQGRGLHGQWHLVCGQCEQSVLALTRGESPFTWTISELLTSYVAHMTQCHAVELTYEHYGESYA